MGSTVWIGGGTLTSWELPHGFTRSFYSWAGPGSAWIKKPNLPETMFFHNLVYDGRRSIWALALTYSSSVFEFSLDDETWSTKERWSRWRYSACVLCQNYIITFGGWEQTYSTDTILVTDIRTGRTVKSSTKLPSINRQHCAARIIATKP